MPKSPAVVLTPVAAHNLATWRQIKGDLARVQEAELLYRLTLEQQIGFDPDKTEGSQTVTLPDGNGLSLDRPTNYTLVKDIPTVQTALHALHEINPAAAQTIIRWEPILNEGEFKKLGEAERRIIAAIVTSKPGLIAIEYKPRKETK